MTDADFQAEIESLKVNRQQLAARVRLLEKQVETLWTPWWKKILFAVDGWPLYRIAQKRQWRPWHK